MEACFAQAPGQSIMGGYQVLTGLAELAASPAFPSNFRITGNEPQLLTVYLQPQQEFISESGTLVAKAEGVDHHATWGGCFDCMKRGVVAGEAMVRLRFKNNTSSPQGLALTPNYPASVIPINMDAINNKITIKSSAFFAATDVDAKFSIRLPNSIGVALVGGMGLLLNSVHAKGWLFVNAAGTILTRSLAAGEEIVTDQQSLVAFSETCEFTYRLAVPRECAAGCVACCCAGEGGFNSVIKGPGFVILQSCPFENIAKQLSPGGDGGGGDGGGGGG